MSVEQYGPIDYAKLARKLREEVLREITPTNIIYLPLTITAKAGTTTTVDEYPADGRVWYINKIRIVTSANTKAVMKIKCYDGEGLNQFYAQQAVATDKTYYLKDDFGSPMRCVQLELVFTNSGTADEDQTVEVDGFEALKKLP